jgi:hypothetical protein
MSKMAELSYDIQELYIEGHSAKTIAALLDCPIEQVLGYLQDMGVQDEPEDFSPYVSMNS